MADVSGFEQRNIANNLFIIRIHIFKKDITSIPITDWVRSIARIMRLPAE